MKLFSFKTIKIPAGEQAVKAFESWTVRWQSFEGYGSMYAQKKDEAEVFTTKEDAENFAFAIKAAYKLTKCRHQDPQITQN